MVRLLAIVGATALGCSLFTSLDFVGNSKRVDAGVNAEDGSADIGECAEPCSDGQICKEGHCTCPTGSIECEGSCLDSESLQDAGYCGTCGAVCRDDQSCHDGGCSCQPGETECGTTCADLSSSPDHCGKCETACQSGQACIHGACKSSPCEDLCANPTEPQVSAEGFRMDQIGTGELCVAVSGYLPTLTNSRVVCWNFDSTRILRVNGQQISCVTGDGYALPAAPQGWYCVQVGAGGSASGGFLLPNY